MILKEELNKKVNIKLSRLSQEEIKMWDKNKRGKERKDDIPSIENNGSENMQRGEVKRTGKEDNEKIKSKMKETLQHTEENTEEMTMAKKEEGEKVKSKMKEAPHQAETHTEEIVEEMVTEETVATDLCSGEQTFITSHQEHEHPVPEISGNTEADTPGHEQTDLYCEEQIEPLRDEEENNPTTEQSNNDKDNDTPTTDEDILPNSNDFVSLTSYSLKKLTIF